VKVKETLLPGEPITPGCVFKIGSQEFAVREGDLVTLDSCWRDILDFDSTALQSDVSLDEFLELKFDTSLIPEVLKVSFFQKLTHLKHLPRKIKKLKFISEEVCFEVGYKELTIGSDQCDINLRNVAGVICKVIYTNGWHFLVNLDEVGFWVYRKLEEAEECPLLPGISFRVGSLEFEATRFNVGRLGAQGQRSQMEDADLVIHNLFLFEELAVSFFGVFDGHGGQDCADFLKKNLSECFRKKVLEKRHRTQDVFGTIKESIAETYQEIDMAFYNEFPTKAGSVGSAALVCLVVGDRILTVNLGDSRAVLSRQGTAIELSVDHKPNFSKERDRILKHGGHVYMGRLQGVLSVSRAFGDFDFKLVNPELTNFKGSLVSSEPEVTQIFMDPQKDEFLLIACDGLYEAYSSQQVVDTIRRKLMAMPPDEQDPNRVIREVINEAIFQEKTTDNVTAILVILKCGIEN